MKTLKFEPALLQSVLEGSKTTTWRLFDDKDLSVEDELSLLDSETKEEFAKARVISVKEKTLGELTEEDWEGHERFSSDPEMYKTYSGYYNCDVTDRTSLKIVHFELI